MKCRCKHSSIVNDKDLESIGLSSQSITGVSVGSVYIVYAISHWRKVCFYLIIDDQNMTAWLPAMLFENIDNRMPAGWIFNYFGTEVELVIGPPFIAESLESYCRMVESDQESQRIFWDMVKQISAEQV